MSAATEHAFAQALDNVDMMAIVESHSDWRIRTEFEKRDVPEAGEGEEASRSQGNQWAETAKAPHHPSDTTPRSCPSWDRPRSTASDRSRRANKNGRRPKPVVRRLPLLGSNQDSPDPESESSTRLMRATCPVTSASRGIGARKQPRFRPLLPAQREPKGTSCGDGTIFQRPSDSPPGVAELEFEPGHSCETQVRGRTPEPAALVAQPHAGS
jgi:hypothetical protein